MNKINTNSKSKRIFYFDELRVLAIFFVILVHVSQHFARVSVKHTLFWSFSASLKAFGSVGVPLFFMISGALLLNREYGNIIDFYKKRISRIAIPFAFWIIFIVYVLVTFFDKPFTFNGVCHMAIYDGFPWFFWTLLGLYLFMPVINSFIKEYSIKGAEIFLVFWILTMILSTLGKYPIKQVELRYFSGYLGYVVLGWYLTNKKFKLSNNSILISSIIMFLISTTAYIHIILNNIPLHERYYLTIFPVFQAAGVFLFFKYIDNLSEINRKSFISKIHNFIKESRIGKAILSISICSYGMYLSHYFFIWPFMITNNTYHILSRNPFKWIPVVMLIAILGSWALIWVMSKIPVLKRFSGV